MQNRKTLLFILNPNAGKGKIRQELFDIIQCFLQNGYEVTVYYTQSAKDAYTKVLQSAEEYNMLVCSGGDGTLNECVAALLELKQPPQFAYLPAGTTNDFASSLEIPKDMDEAAQVAMNGKHFLDDVGSLNQRIFTYVAAFGSVTEITYQTPQKVKNTIGYFAYLLEALKKLHNHKSYHLIIQANGKQWEDEFIYGIVSNSHYIAGFKNPFNKFVTLDDGKFEVILIRKPQNIIDLPMSLTLPTDGYLEKGMVLMFQTSALSIQSQEALPWTLDGEYGGSYHFMDIKNHQQALDIIIPNWASSITNSWK